MQTEDAYRLIPFLSACSDTTRGQAKIQKKDYLERGEYPVIDQGQEFIAGYTDRSKALYSGALPVVLFGDHTRVFKYVDQPFALGADGVKVLSAENGIDAKYLYYFLLSRDIPSRGYSRHFKFLKQVEVPLPAPSEQRRIVEILDQADALRKKRAEADKLADRILPALFYKMFGDPATNPMGWDVGTVFDYCRQDKKGVNEVDGEGLPYLGLEHVEEGSGRILVTASDAKQINVRGNAFLFSDDHILYGKLRPYLNKVALPTFRGRCSTELVPLMPKRDYPREFVAAFLRLPYVVTSAMATNKGARMPRTDMKLLMNMPAIKPKKELRYEFADQYRKLNRNCENRLNAVKKIDSLFTILLHRAFSGELTAKWREAHMNELLQEMEQQAKELQKEVKA